MQTITLSAHTYYIDHVTSYMFVYIAIVSMGKEVLLISWSVLVSSPGCFGEGKKMHGIHCLLMLLSVRKFL